MPAGIPAVSPIVSSATPLLERDRFQAIRLPRMKEEHMSLSTSPSTLKPRSVVSPLPDVIGLGGALAGLAGGLAMAVVAALISISMGQDIWHESKRIAAV